jgi:hypothetical protein
MISTLRCSTTKAQLGNCRTFCRSAVSPASAQTTIAYASAPLEISGEGERVIFTITGLIQAEQVAELEALVSPSYLIAISRSI